jgi:hypothetical protein
LTHLEKVRGKGVRSSRVVEDATEKAQADYDAEAGDEWLDALQKREGNV